MRNPQVLKNVGGHRCFSEFLPPDELFDRPDSPFRDKQRYLLLVPAVVVTEPASDHFWIDGGKFVGTRHKSGARHHAMTRDRWIIIALHNTADGAHSIRPTSLASDHLIRKDAALWNSGDDRENFARKYGNAFLLHVSVS